LRGPVGVVRAEDEGSVEELDGEEASEGHDQAIGEQRRGGVAPADNRKMDAIGR
jgi:hypothetical protein